jgi:hypothetical protein
MKSTIGILKIRKNLFSILFFFPMRNCMNELNFGKKGKKSLHPTCSVHVHDCATLLILATWLVYRTMWSRCLDVVVGGHIFELGNRWGREKGTGRERGGQYTSNLGPEWTGIAPHAKEGFQVSKRDSEKGVQGQGRDFPGKGIIKGITKGIVPCASDNANLVHNVPIVCMWC